MKKIVGIALSFTLLLVCVACEKEEYLEELEAFKDNFQQVEIIPDDVSEEHEENFDVDESEDLTLEETLDLEETQEDYDEEVLLEPEEDAVPVVKGLVVIDAGHQAVGNSSQEAIGPGAATTKAKVTSGTTGRFTGIPEYVLNLEVSLLLEQDLIEMGYEVVMIRSVHDVDISNAERAAVANELNADAFIRIHANGSDDATVNGAFTICPTPYNPYCPEIYADSRLLSEYVLDAFVAETGAYKRSIWETDTMSGINWCQVPVTIIEMGFMTNQQEDLLMATQEYREKISLGMAKGIDQYIQAKMAEN